jgi:hypothetical protein
MGLGGKLGAVAGEALGDVVGSFFGFAKGGKVPGRKGKPVKAIVHGGETVLPIGVKPTMAQKKAIRKMGGKI